MRISVLFVCLGNICRSPLAEAAFRHVTEAAGTEIEIDSAGTGSWHAGAAPDPRAQAVARSHDIDISRYVARQISEGDFHHFSHIIALDSQNLKDLKALRPPRSKAKLSLLLDHVHARQGESVADPYFGEMEDFEITWADVHAAAIGLLRSIRQASG